MAGRLRTDRNTARAAIGARADTGRYFKFGQTASAAWALGSWNEPSLTCKSGVLLGVTSSRGFWYSFKYRVTRASGLTRLRAKLWLQGSTEPGWQADCWTTSTVGSDPGAFALLRSGSGGVYFDDLTVTSVGGTLDPIPPQ
jgi:hypothetical protein